MSEHSGSDFMDEAALDDIDDDSIASADAPDPRDLSDELDEEEIDSKPESAMVPDSPDSNVTGA